MDLTLRATGGASEGEFAEARGIVEVVEVCEGETEGGDEGFGSVGGFGMEDLEGEAGVVEGKGEREGETFVPDGGSVAGVVGFGGETAIGIDPEDDVGLEVAVFPVDVFEVLGGDDG